MPMPHGDAFPHPPPGVNIYKNSVGPQGQKCREELHPSAPAAQSLALACPFLGAAAVCPVAPAVPSVGDFLLTEAPTACTLPGR